MSIQDVVWSQALEILEGRPSAIVDQSLLHDGLEILRAKIKSGLALEDLIKPVVCLAMVGCCHHPGCPQVIADIPRALRKHHQRPLIDKNS